MLSYWCWKQQAKNTSILISLEGTKRGKGQWSIKNNFSILQSIFFSGFYIVLIWFVYHSWKQNTSGDMHSWQIFSSICTAVWDRATKLPFHKSNIDVSHFPWASSLCFQMTKRMLYYAFKIVQPPPSPVNQSITTTCQLTAAVFTLWFGGKRMTY